MTIIDALQSLLAGSEWTIFGDDLATLEIYTKGVKAPTQAQIDAEISRLESVKAAEDAARAAAREALLARLGITSEEAKILVG